MTIASDLNSLLLLIFALNSPSNKLIKRTFFLWWSSIVSIVTSHPFETIKDDLRCEWSKSLGLNSIVIIDGFGCLFIVLYPAVNKPKIDRDNNIIYQYIPIQCPI